MKRRVLLGARRWREGGRVRRGRRPRRRGARAAAIAGGADDRVGLDVDPPARRTARPANAWTAGRISISPVLIVWISSVSTIAGATPRRRRRVIGPASGTGSPYSLRSLMLIRRAKRASASAARVGRWSIATPIMSPGMPAGPSRRRMLGGVRTASQTWPPCRARIVRDFHPGAAGSDDEHASASKRPRVAVLR